MRLHRKRGESGTGRNGGLLLMKIEKLTENYYPQVAEIYREGIATRNATFETEAPTWDKWNSGHLLHTRLIAVKSEKVAGWAALSPVSERCVYGGVAEVSIYVANAHKNKGIGKALLKELIAESEANGIWTLQSGIFPENVYSIRLHEKYGFRQVGYREKIGKMENRWRDTVILERRSKTIGTD